LYQPRPKYPFTPGYEMSGTVDAVGEASSIAEIASLAYADTPDAHPGLSEDQTLSHLLVHERDGHVHQTSNGWVLNE